jgi:hypothetical protein
MVKTVTSTGAQISAVIVNGFNGLIVAEIARYTAAILPAVLMRNLFCQTGKTSTRQYLPIKKQNMLSEKHLFM